MNKLRQLALNLCLKDTTTFANFFVGANKQLVNVLRNIYRDNSHSFVYLWGNQGSGKSHLLSALCQLFNEHNLVAAYLPLEDLKQLTPQIFEDLEKLNLLCIDDLNLIAGNLLWEENIFHCFNKIATHNKKIVISANALPKSLPLVLPDLKSRMLSGLIFEIQALSDEEKMAGLKLRAKLRGLELNDAVTQFLLCHYARDTKSLFATLDKLDKAALTAQRKLTIPFVKSVLQNTNI